MCRVSSSHVPLGMRQNPRQWQWWSTVHLRQVWKRRLNDFQGDSLHLRDRQMDVVKQTEAQFRKNPIHLVGQFSAASESYGRLHHSRWQHTVLSVICERPWSADRRSSVDVWPCATGVSYIVLSASPAPRHSKLSLNEDVCSLGPRLCHKQAGLLQQPACRHQQGTFEQAGVGIAFGGSSCHGKTEVRPNHQRHAGYPPLAPSSPKDRLQTRRPRLQVSSRRCSVLPGGIGVVGCQPAKSPKSPICHPRRPCGATDTNSENGPTQFLRVGSNPVELAPTRPSFMRTYFRNFQGQIKIPPVSLCVHILIDSQISRELCAPSRNGFSIREGGIKMICELNWIELNKSPEISWIFYEFV